MKTGRSLTDLAQEIERQSKNKKDFIIPTERLEMNPTGELQFFQNGGDLERFPLNGIAHSQLASHLNIPATYYNRLLEQDRDLLSQNVNKWLHTNPTKRMVRTLDGKARGFLSDKFHLGLENLDIATAALPILLESGARVESAEITEGRLYIKAVYPKLEGEVSKGDVVQAGIAISNSEVGLGALTIQPLVYRLVCLNGAIFADSKFSQRHLGQKIVGMENVAHLLSNEALAADDKAMSLKVRDVIRACFDQAVFAQRLDALRVAKGDKLVGDINEVVEVVSKRNAFSDFEKTNILRNLIEGADLSRYGLHNAITRTAQDVDSYDRATVLETVGGNIITLGSSDYKILEAA